MILFIYLFRSFTEFHIEFVFVQPKTVRATTVLYALLKGLASIAHFAPLILNVLLILKLRLHLRDYYKISTLRLQSYIRGLLLLFFTV